MTLPARGVGPSFEARLILLARSLPQPSLLGGACLAVHVLKISPELLDIIFVRCGLFVPVERQSENVCFAPFLLSLDLALLLPRPTPIYSSSLEWNLLFILFVLEILQRARPPSPCSLRMVIARDSLLYLAV